MSHFHSVSSDRVPSDHHTALPRSSLPMASAAVFAIRRCSGRPAAVSLTVLVTAAVVASASAIAAVVTTDHVLLPRVCVLQQLDGRLLNGISICSPWYASSRRKHGGKTELTSKCLLDIHHFPCACLHKSTPPLTRPLEACPTAYHTALF